MSNPSPQAPQQAEDTSQSRVKEQWIVTILSYVIGLVSVIGLFGLKSAAAIGVACLIAVTLAALSLRLLRLWARGQLDWPLVALIVALALSTIVPLLVVSSEGRKTVAGLPQANNESGMTVTSTTLTATERRTTTSKLTSTAQTTSAPTIPEARPFFLAAEKPAMNTGWETGAVKLNATEYLDALLIDICPSGFSDDGTQSIVYVIDRKYAVLRAVAGVPDSARSEAPMTFVVRGDGQQLYRQTTTVGKPLNVEVPITNVLRLELAIQYTTEWNVCHLDGAAAAWAEVRVE
jgi:NPCBM/NEW2 domain